jgi:hypothetical protein
MTLRSIVLRYGIVTLSMAISLVGFYAMSRWFSNQQWTLYGTTLILSQLAKELFQMKLEKVLARDGQRKRYEVVILVQTAALMALAAALLAVRDTLGQGPFVVLAAASVGVSMSIIAIADFNLATRRVRTYLPWKLYLPSSIVLCSYIFAHSGLRSDPGAMVYAALCAYGTSIVVTLATTGIRLRHQRPLATYLETLRTGLDIVRHEYPAVLMNVAFNVLAIGALSRILSTDFMGDFFKIQRGLAMIGNNLQNVTRAIYMKHWDSTDREPFDNVVRSSMAIMAVAVVLAVLLRPTLFSFLNIAAESAASIVLVFWLLFADFMLKLWEVRDTVPLTMQRRLERFSFIMAVVFVARLAYVGLPYAFGLWSATNGLLIIWAMPIGTAVSVIYLNRYSRHA